MYTQILTSHPINCTASCRGAITPICAPQTADKMTVCVHHKTADKQCSHNSQCTLPATYWNIGRIYTIHRVHHHHKHMDTNSHSKQRETEGKQMTQTLKPEMASSLQINCDCASIPSDSQLVQCRLHHVSIHSPLRKDDAQSHPNDLGLNTRERERERERE